MGPDQVYGEAHPTAARLASAADARRQTFQRAPSVGKAEELAVAVDVLEAGKGKRRKYSMDLRQRLVAFVREQRAAGIQLSFAAGVGVSPTLLHRWDVSRAGSFRRVELQRQAPTSSWYVLHTRQGIRVEGLGLDELVTTSRRLG
jgi:hypothetical protein